MKKLQPIFAITVALIGGAAALHAGPPIAVSVHFNGVDGQGIDNAQSDSLVNLATDPTGATVEQAGAPGFTTTNWNNLDRWGDVASGIVDYTGADSGLHLNWDAPWAAQSGAYANLGTSDGKLMDGMDWVAWGNGNASGPVTASSVYGASGSQKPVVYVGGIKAWLAAQGQGATSYSVVLYVQGWHGWWGTSANFVQSVTSGSPSSWNMVPGLVVTPTLYYHDTGVFNGTYSQIASTCTSAGSASGGGNYMVFNNLTNDAILLVTEQPSGDYNTGTMMGFQIVATPPTPISSAPTISPNPAYALSPVTLTEVASSQSPMTYQWQTDGGSYGSLTNIPGATASTLAVIPPDQGAAYTINYACLVANTFGSVTSLTSTLTVNAATAPIVTKDTNPTNVVTFVGGSVTFAASFDGTQLITNQWQVNKGGGFTGIGLTATTNQTLLLANVQLADAGTYQEVATNAIGTSNSTPTTLTVLADPAAPTAGQAYAYDVYTNSPLAYWRLGEAVDPTAATYQAYDASGHGLNATYGAGVTTGVAGPQSPAYVGFESANTGAGFTQSTANGALVVPPLNLTAANVTITAWIYPTADIATSAGLLVNRSAYSAAGLGFGGNTDANGNSPTYGQAELGYNWNNNSAAYNFHSGLFPPLNNWSFVALTITPSNAVLYLCYTNGDGTGNVLKKINNVANSPEAFNLGTTWLGGDPANANKIFTGSIDEVAVFGKSLTDAQIQNLFITGAGSIGSAPSITAEVSGNATTNMYPGQAPLQITAAGIGLPAPHYQWQAGSGGVFTNLVNGGAISGANSGTLTINPTTTANNLDYQLVLTNVNGSATSSVYTVSLASVPNNGIWTARYQFTNSTGNLGWGVYYGSGSYSGPGVLGSGNFWNPVPGGGDWTGGIFTSVSDFQDNGSTHSGITCQITGTSISAGNATYASNNRHGVLSQFAFYWGSQANAIVFNNVPNGTYNLALHGDDADWNDRGTTFTVHGANGDQSDTTVNNSQTSYFVEGNTSALFTNVTVTNGVLNVDVTPGPTAGGQCAVNGAEIQLVQAAGNPAQIGSVTVSGGNVVITGTSFDLGQSYRILTSTNLLAPAAKWQPVATNTFVGGGFTNLIPVNPANPQVFYRVVEP